MKDRLKEVTQLRQEARHNRKVAIVADPSCAVDFQLDALCNEAAADELEGTLTVSPIVSGEVVLPEAERPDGGGVGRCAIPWPTRTRRQLWPVWNVLIY